MTCALVKHEVTICNGLGGDAFTKNTLFDFYLGNMVTGNVAHHVTYARAQFEVATPNCLGEIISQK